MKRFFSFLTVLLLLGSSALAQELSPLTTSYAHDQLVLDAFALAEKYPQLVTCESAGTSVQGREIPVLTVGAGECYVLVMAGVHATEISNPPMLMAALTELLESPPDFLSKVQMVVVPCVNPDGYERVRGFRDAGKKANKKGNANYINLNRNFPSPYWTPVKNKNSLDYGGETAGSEPETQALMRVIERFPYLAALDLHSQGRYVYYGKSGFQQADVKTTLDVAVLDARGKTLAQALRPASYRLSRQSAAAKKNKYGSTTDYAFSLGIPAITIETMPNGSYSIKHIQAEYNKIDLPALLGRLCETALQFAQENEENGGVQPPVDKLPKPLGGSQR